MALLKLPHPGRDLAKYPNPLDEPLLENCRRIKVRPPRPGEDTLSWSQSDPFYLESKATDEEILKEWEDIKAEWDALGTELPEPVLPSIPYRNQAALESFLRNNPGATAEQFRDAAESSGF